jgi:plasmid stability protein
MANLTVTIDDDTLRRARSRAIENGTSVNAMIRDFLEAFAGADLDKARADLLQHAAEFQGSSGPGGRSWTRDDVHER